MSIHISAKKGEIAPVVLMPGDPLRAQYMAEKYLQDTRQVNKTRNIFFYTGTYKNELLSIGASGMGCPSIGIYSYELYNEYDVDCIIRVGTCGAYRDDIKLYQLINAESAYSESTYARSAFGWEEDNFFYQGAAYNVINETAGRLGMDLMKGPIHSGDAFYRMVEGLPPIAVENNLLAAEMEAFALFANAKAFKKSAACLLTVSDNIITRQIISAEEREKTG
jgi:purine-nucleoside phosphorylase